MSWYEVCDRRQKEGYESLSEPEQIWISTRALIDAVHDGGLVSYFYNSWADNYDETTYALGELEAFEVLDILESFAEFFGDEVPFDGEERNAIINSWTQRSPEAVASEHVDSVLMPLLDDLETTLHAYLTQHGVDPVYSR